MIGMLPCRRGMEANVTLFWFVLPKWFMDMGAFEKEENIEEFVEWGRLAFELFGALVWRGVLPSGRPCCRRCGAAC